VTCFPFRQEPSRIVLLPYSRRGDGKSTAIQIFISVAGFFPKSSLTPFLPNQPSSMLKSRAFAQKLQVPPQDPVRSGREDRWIKAYRNIVKLVIAG
jgi:hypothetical protein